MPKLAPLAQGPRPDIIVHDNDASGNLILSAVFDDGTEIDLGYFHKGALELLKIEDGAKMRLAPFMQFVDSALVVVKR